MRIIAKLVLLSAGLITFCAVQAQTNTNITVHTPDGDRVLQYELVDNFAMTEGDIILAERDLKSRASSIPGDVHSTRWLFATMPYQIDSDVPKETVESIYKAMQVWKKEVGIHFVKRTNWNKFLFKDYVRFVKNDATICSSHVGKAGGEQKIVLAKRCSRWNIVHEIGHALGLWHEQSRSDRDLYITINWNNIKDNKAYNFNKHDKDGIDIGPYNYDSIMHYGAKAFSKNGEVTIQPKDKDATIGQRDHLSEGDIAAVKLMYF